MDVRKANLKDIKSIGKIYTESWKITYRGMIAQEYLESLNIQDAEDKWERFLNDKNNILLVAEKDHKVIGFIAGCGTDIATQAELYALYTDINLKNMGIGSKLLTSLIIELKNTEMQSLIVWAMAQNINAISYYKHKGALEYQDRINTLGNERIKDLCLIWKNIHQIKS